MPAKPATIVFSIVVVSSPVDKYGRGPVICEGARNKPHSSLVERGMNLRPILAFASLVAGLAAGQMAFAQSAQCQRYRAELASLGRAGGMEGAAQRQRQEIARLSGYYQSIGCGRGQFLFFGGAPPEECSAIAQRINMMQASYARLAGQAESYNSEARRRQITAAIQEACNPQREAVIRREAEERRARATAAEDEASPRRSGGSGGSGGSRLVCVRACDGYFFPLHNLPQSGRSDADDMCKALCPGAEAAAYSMPGGDGDIAQAVSLRGKRYTKLAAAFKYQKGVDSSCSCRKDGQSWAEALQKAEKMIERGKGDIIVTAKKAEELSRPKLTRKGKPKPAEAQVAAKAVDVETTGSITPSAGAGPQDTGAAKQGSEAPAEAEKLAGESEGQKTESAETTRKRSIRVVGPTFISLPLQGAE
jgi:hypothetical protein